MKKYSFLLLILFLACKDEAMPLVPMLELERDNIILPVLHANTIMFVETNIDDWTATVAETGTSWCSVRKETVQEGYLLHIEVTENESFDERTTEISVVASTLQQSISVRQLGVKPALAAMQENFNVPAVGSQITIAVIANVDFDTLTTVSWLRPVVSMAAHVTSVTYSVKFDVEANLDTKERTTEIVFRQKNGDLSSTVKVKQAARDTEYKPDAISGFENDFEIAVLRGEASEAQSGEGIEKSFDGRMDTWYHSRWGTGTRFPVTLTYYFEYVEKMDYLIYYPRTSGYNGRVKELEVFVSTGASPDFQSIGEYDFKGSGAPSVLAFPESLENPKAVRLVIHSGTGDNVGSYVSCAEMKFFRKNPVNSPDKTIFADDIFSQLQPTVTEEMILNMENEFLKNIAFSIFMNEYPSEFRVQSFRAFPNPDIRAAENKTSTYSLLDNPTGIMVEAGKNFVVFVGETHGQSISLRVIDFNNGYGGADYILLPGVNQLNITGSGLAYIMYHTDNLSAQPIQIHFPSGVVNGYFDRTKHSGNDWSRLLNGAKEAHFDVLGQYAHLTFPVANLRNNNSSSGTRLIEIYDSIVFLQQQHMGLFKYGREFKNRLFFHVVYDNSYMYATSYRTAYHQGTMTELCDPRRLRTSSIWGPAHEAGHVNQTRPGFRWVGMTEVSNNVHSLLVQTTFGNTSRLHAEARYEAAFTKIISARALHASHGDVFEKLVPFWQLELYFSKVKEFTDYYGEIYQTIRTTPNPSDNGTAQLNFVKMCCDVAGVDLTEFFDAWGMLSPINLTVDDYSAQPIVITQAQVDELKTYLRKYPAPAHKIQYIQDNNLDLYRSNAAITKGSVSKSGSVWSLTNWSNLVACEIYDADDNLLLATSKSSFTVPVNGQKVYAVGASGEKILL